jgi:hypothetical protein
MIPTSEGIPARRPAPGIVELNGLLHGPEIHILVEGLARAVLRASELQQGLVTSGHRVNSIAS